MAHSENQELIHANQLMKEGKIKEANQILLELEKRDDLSPQDLLSYKLLKANLLCKLRIFLDAIKYGEDIYQESQKQGDLLSSFDGLCIQAYAHGYLGDIILIEEIVEQAEVLFKKIKENYKIDLRERESFFLRIKANFCGWKGEIQSALELNKKAFKLAKDLGNKELISIGLNNIADNYIYLKEYDKAIFYAKEAVKINYEPILLVRKIKEQIQLNLQQYSQ